MKMYLLKASWGETHSVWPDKESAEVMGKRIFDFEYEIVPVEVREIKREKTFPTPPSRPP